MVARGNGDPDLGHHCKTKPVAVLFDMTVVPVRIKSSKNWFCAEIMYHGSVQSTPISCWFSLQTSNELILVALGLHSSCNHSLTERSSDVDCWARGNAAVGNADRVRGSPRLVRTRDSKELDLLHSSLSRCSNLVSTTCLLVSSISPARNTSSRIA